MYRTEQTVHSSSVYRRGCKCCARVSLCVFCPLLKVCTQTKWWHNTQFVFPFRFTTTSEIVEALDGIRQRRGGTNTSDAITTMRNMFSQNPASSRKRIGILVTDGVADRTAMIAGDDGITLFVVGIGTNVNK